MSKRSCAWLGADGKCKCEFIANKYKKRMKCEKLEHCKAYITNYALEKKLNKSAHDREITDDTRFLVKLYHSEGDTVNQIAAVLDRSPKAIKKILEDCENGKRKSDNI